VYVTKGDWVFLLGLFTIGVPLTVAIGGWLQNRRG
jgi:hypothetical protein